MVAKKQQQPRHWTRWPLSQLTDFFHLFFLFLFFGLGGGRWWFRGTPFFLIWSVLPSHENPYFISDQNIRFSIFYFWLEILQNDTWSGIKLIYGDNTEDIFVPLFSFPVRKWQEETLKLVSNRHSTLIVVLSLKSEMGTDWLMINPFIPKFKKYILPTFLKSNVWVR